MVTMAKQRRLIDIILKISSFPVYMEKAALLKKKILGDFEWVLSFCNVAGLWYTIT